MRDFFESKPVRVILTILLVFVLVAFVFTVGSALVDPSRKQFASGGVMIPGKTCQCYCSDKCGPRDIKYGIDRPFVDRETGLCFCADRDKVNYIPNRCTPKSFSNTCCG